MMSILACAQLYIKISKLNIFYFYIRYTQGNVNVRLYAINAKKSFTVFFFIIYQSFSEIITNI